jgi:hypothetical protein
MGSHDYVAPSFISACKLVLDRDPGVVLAYPLARVVDGSDETIKEIVPEFIDTRGLPTFARVLVVVRKVEYCALELYGLFRTAALRRCRPLSKRIANDLILISEISILGSIALVPEVLFYRRDLGTVWTGDEAMAKNLLRVNPEVDRERKVRPFWELGIQQVAGAWRLAPLPSKLYLPVFVAHSFYSRWHRQLKRELHRPYSLQEHREPEF